MTHLCHSWLPVMKSNVHVKSLFHKYTHIDNENIVNELVRSNDSNNASHRGITNIQII